MAEIKFTGNLGRDAELTFTQSGAAKLAFSVADSKSRKDQSGQWETLAEQWMRCTLWGPDAEHYAERLKKGARVTVYGEFYARDYTDNQGAARYSLDVTVRGLSIQNKRGAEQAVGADSQQPSHGAWSPTPAPDQQGYGQQPPQPPAHDPWAAPQGNEPPF